MVPTGSKSGAELGVIAENRNKSELCPAFEESEGDGNQKKTARWRKTNGRLDIRTLQVESTPASGTLGEQIALNEEGIDLAGHARRMKGEVPPRGLRGVEVTAVR